MSRKTENFEWDVPTLSDPPSVVPISAAFDQVDATVKQLLEKAENTASSEVTLSTTQESYPTPSVANGAAATNQSMLNQQLVASANYQRNRLQEHEDRLNNIGDSGGGDNGGAAPPPVQKDTALNWQSENPILPMGIFGYESTRRRFKMGDGKTAWNSLNFIMTEPSSSYVPPPPSDGLENDEWSTIAAISASIANGSITDPYDPTENPYSVGDIKNITLTTGEPITLEILGFNHDDKVGGGKAGITFGMRYLMANTQRMNATHTNAGGWHSSEMRTVTLPSIMATLPTELQAVLANITKMTANGGSQSGTTVAPSEDKVFLFSMAEVNPNPPTWVHAGEGVQYEYWRTVRNGGVNADRIKQLANGTGAANWWLLRSPTALWDNFFAMFNTTGNARNGSAANAIGVCLGFCV